MIKINLLPEYRRKTEFPTWKLYRVVAYGLLGLSILLWGYHLAMFKYTESRLSDVNASIASMQVWQERFDKAQIQNAEINKRNTIVRNLSKDRIVWSSLLAELGNVTPYGCWLTSVKQGRSSRTDDDHRQGLENGRCDQIYRPVASASGYFQRAAGNCQRSKKQ